MLNISKRPTGERKRIAKYSSMTRVNGRKHYKLFNRILGFAALLGVIILFLPWTQNTSGIGRVTALSPDQRPQTLQSPIPGRLEKWYVQEGDAVKKGDTLVFISEIKTEYQDTLLVDRTLAQRDAKASSVDSYALKEAALRSQQGALARERELKLKQASNKLEQSRLKVITATRDLEAARANRDVAQTQLTRTETLRDEGLKSQADVEEKRLKLQETEAKLISAQNKLLTSENDVSNAEVEINRVSAEYAEKISKASSDLASATSSRLDVEAQVSKLNNTASNYQRRRSQQFLTAPLDGFINKVLRGGIGEAIKEGEPLVGIMPQQYDLAVEMFVDPIDLPLIHVGSEVRIQFDGWPAIVFSGWPGITMGTYAGHVVAVETFISDNGKFRILVAPDEKDAPWPDLIRVGAGARGIALFNEVPIWYELWRQLNGFPPDYYSAQDAAASDKKK